MKNKIGFFGGSFNPPSKTHISLAKKLLKEKTIDKVIFVPVGDFYNKQELIQAKHRYNMLKIATEELGNVEVSDIEMHINKKLYAADIFELIEKEHNNSENYYIMGADNYNKMHMWKDYEEIKNKYKYIVLERNKKDISSTNIRNMIKNNLNTSDVLDENVLKYIQKNQLYI